MRLVWAVVVVGVGCGGQSNAPPARMEVQGDASADASMSEDGADGASPNGDSASGIDAMTGDVNSFDASSVMDGFTSIDASGDVGSNDAGSNDVQSQETAALTDAAPEGASGDASESSDGPTGACFPDSMTCCYGGSLPCCCSVQSADEWLQVCQAPAFAGATCEQSPGATGPCVTPASTGACPI